MRIGAHVDQLDPVGDALDRGANLAQFFLGDPQSWKKPTVAYAAGPAALKAAAEEADVALYIHAPYVINVASTNNRIRIPSRKLLQQTVTLAAEIGAAGVIVHGGHVTKDDDPEAGYDNWRKCIEGLDLACPVLIENTAGGANAMARTMDRIERLWEVVASAQGGEEIGFCLDTCHAHAGGHELVGLVERIKEVTGRIDLLHLNDSRDPFDSGADRHANLGQGQCDPTGIVDVAVAAGAPICLETPGGLDGHVSDMTWLREQMAAH